MLRHNGLALWLGFGLAGLAVAACQTGSPGPAAPAESLALKPATMPRTGTIEDRFQESPGERFFACCHVNRRTNP